MCAENRTLDYFHQSSHIQMDIFDFRVLLYTVDSKPEIEVYPTSMETTYYTDHPVLLKRIQICQI